MGFADADLTEDRFLGGRLRILQPRFGYRAATDPVLLAAAVAAQPGQSVLELGCGAGVASLCLAIRLPGLRLWGLELQAEYADLARRNAALNGVAIEVVGGDIAAMPAMFRALHFDHVIANPPYFPARSGTPARNDGREQAQREDLPLADWMATGLRRLRPGGWLTVIQLADRLPDLLAALGRSGSITVLPLQPRAGRPSNRMILRLKKSGRSPFVLLPAVVMHDGPAHDGDRDSHSPVAQAVLRDGAALPMTA